MYKRQEKFRLAKERRHRARQAEKKKKEKKERKEQEQEQIGESLDENDGSMLLTADGPEGEGSTV